MTDPHMTPTQARVLRLLDASGGEITQHVFSNLPSDGVSRDLFFWDLKERGWIEVGPDGTYPLTSNGYTALQGAGR